MCGDIMTGRRYDEGGLGGAGRFWLMYMVHM